MLSAKQQRFVDEFSLDHNASRAARAAGYSSACAKVTASRLLTNANVRAAVTLREMEAENSLEMTRERVLKALQEAFEAAREQREPAAMIAACRAIAQICGYYTPERNKVEVTTDATMVHRLYRLSDAELAAMISGSM